MSTIKKLLCIGMWLFFSLALSANEGICGRVTGPDGAGLEGATVTIYYYDDYRGYTPLETQNTDKNGDYCFSFSFSDYYISYPYDHHIVSFSHPNFLQQYYDNKASESDATHITLQLGEFKKGIDARMKSGGGISGRVVGPDGQGLLANVRFWYREVSGFWNYVESSTDNTGNYKSPPLNEGKYTVFFDPQDKRYLPEWFNNRTTQNIQDFVNLIANQITSGINAQLEKGGSISGRVSYKNPPGNLKNTTIKVELYNAITGEPCGSSTYPDDSGHFQFFQLLPGDYLLYFYTYDKRYFSTWYYNQNVKERATPIRVNAGEAKVVRDTILRPSSLISGRVTNHSGFPLKDVMVIAFDSKTYTQMKVDFTGVYGKYRISGLPPGEYSLYFSSKENYIPEWYNNKTSWQRANKIVVGSASTVQADTVKLSEGGILQGNLTGPQGEEFHYNINVAVYDSPSGDLMGYAETNQNEPISMNFSISGLPTGKYKLFFRSFDNGTPYDAYWHADGWYSGKKTKETATEIFVQEGFASEWIQARLDYGGVITGALTSQNGGYHISGDVQISCYDVETNVLWKQTSGYMGLDYCLIGLPAGNYRVYFHPSDQVDVQSEWYNDKSSMEAADIVSVRAREITYGIDAHFNLSGSISGHVKTSRELKFGTIKIFAVEANSGQVVKETKANSSGYYKISGLPEGNYLVNFRVEMGKIDDSISEWFKGKNFQNYADLVPVTLGHTTGGIDADLTLNLLHSSRVEKRPMRGGE